MPRHYLLTYPPSAIWSFLFRPTRRAGSFLHSWRRVQKIAQHELLADRSWLWRIRRYFEDEESGARAYAKAQERVTSVVQEASSRKQAAGGES